MGKFRQVNIPNLPERFPKIFISGKTDAENPDLIYNNNIKVIFEVTDKTSFKKLEGVAHFHIWMSDPLETLANENPLYESAIMLEAAYGYASKNAGNILIHCCSGNNRSALVTALFLNKTQEISLKDAVKLCRVKDNKPWMKAFGLNW